MNQTKQIITLTNDTNNEINNHIIKLLGDVVVLKVNDYGDGDLEFDGMELKDGHTNDLLILDDNSWGSVVLVEMIDGHLVLTANYGDEGECCFSATISDHRTKLQGTTVFKLRSNQIGRLQTFDEI